MAKKVEKTRWDLDKIVPVALIGLFAVGGLVFAVAARFGQGSTATASQRPQAAAISYIDLLKGADKQRGQGAAGWGAMNAQRIIETHRQVTERIMQSAQDQPMVPRSR